MIGNIFYIFCSLICDDLSDDIKMLHPLSPDSPHPFISRIPSVNQQNVPCGRYVIFNSVYTLETLDIQGPEVFYIYQILMIKQISTNLMSNVWRYVFNIFPVTEKASVQILQIYKMIRQIEGVHSSFGLKIVLNIRCTELNGTVKHFLCIEFENIP